MAVYATAYDYTYVCSRKGLRMLPPEWVYNERYVPYSSLIPLVVSAILNSQYTEFYLDTDYDLRISYFSLTLYNLYKYEKNLLHY